MVDSSHLLGVEQQQIGRQPAGHPEDEISNAAIPVIEQDVFQNAGITGRCDERIARNRFRAKIIFKHVRHLTTPVAFIMPGDVGKCRPLFFYRFTTRNTNAVALKGEVTTA